MENFYELFKQDHVTKCQEKNRGHGYNFELSGWDSVLKKKFHLIYTVKNES